MTQIIDELAGISQNYDALFVDLWGCLHNGVKPFAGAVKALQGYDGTVVLLTNSPRPNVGVAPQLEQIGVPAEIYDGIVSSGDSAQFAMASGVVGKKVYHIGPERDLGFFEGIDVERVPLDQAEGIVCTGLFNDRSETPDDYRLTILTGVNRGLKMLCANPDIIVDAGDQRIYCAGAIAQAYSVAGGESLYFGKPHPPIYQLAYKRLAEITGHTIEPERILCIGDGINTDIRGGMAENLDTLFITGGLAASEISHDDGPNPQELETFLQAHQLSPTYVMGHLK